jgi:hypothetical protein
MGDIDFAHHAGFSWYCLLLIGSGVAMVAIALVKAQTRGSQIINLIFGAAFFAYGFYLTFMFAGGHYFIFFQAFVLPIVLIVNTLRTASYRRRAARGAVASPAAGPAPFGGPQYGGPAPYGEPMQYGGPAPTPSGEPTQYGEPTQFGGSPAQ